MQTDYFWRNTYTYNTHTYNFWILFIYPLNFEGGVCSNYQDDLFYRLQPSRTSSPSFESLLEDNLSPPVRRHFVPRHIVPGHILSRDNMSLLKSVLKVVVGVHRRDILSRWCSSRGDILSRYQLFGNKWITSQQKSTCWFFLVVFGSFGCSFDQNNPILT